jgi:hypothetical protein
MWMRGHFTSVYIHVRTQAWVPVEGYTSAVAGSEGAEPSFSPPAGNGHVAVCSVVRRHAATAASASAFVVAACARRAAECYESHGCAAAGSAVECGCCLPSANIHMPHPRCAACVVIVRAHGRSTQGGAHCVQRSSARLTARRAGEAIRKSQPRRSARAWRPSPTSGMVAVLILRPLRPAVSGSRSAAAST